MNKSWVYMSISRSAVPNAVTVISIRSQVDNHRRLFRGPEDAHSEAAEQLFMRRRYDIFRRRHADAFRQRLCAVLNEIAKRFYITEKAEITFEANPESLTGRRPQASQGRLQPRLDRRSVKR